MRDLSAAKVAYDSNDVEASKVAHAAKSTEQHSEGGKYIKSIIYGGLDGIICSFAHVAGVTGMPYVTVFSFC